MSDSLRPHGLQHTRPPCLSPSPRVYSNSCPLSRQCHPTISSSVPLLLLPSVFPSIRVFSNESTLCITWPKYWSFSFNISPSNEHSGLISFRMDWLDLLAVQGTLKSLLQHHKFKSINSSALSFLYSPTLSVWHKMFLTYSILKSLFKSISCFCCVFFPQEKRKAEEALSDLRRQYETEVGDLQVTIKKLKKVGIWQLTEG